MYLRNPQSSLLAAVLLLSPAPPAFAYGEAAAPAAVFGNGVPHAVYKFVDDSGKVSYSSTRPQDKVGIEQVAIRPGPSDEDIDHARRRYESISDGARMLQRAREERRAEREEAEKKRLERLALQAAARPQVYERRIYVGWRPWGWPYARSGHSHKASRLHPSGRQFSRDRRLQSIPLH